MSEIGIVLLQVLIAFLYLLVWLCFVSLTVRVAARAYLVERSKVNFNVGLNLNAEQ